MKNMRGERRMNQGGGRVAEPGREQMCKFLRLSQPGRTLSDGKRVVRGRSLCDGWCQAGDPHCALRQCSKPINPTHINTIPQGIARAIPIGPAQSPHLHPLHSLSSPAAMQPAPAAAGRQPRSQAQCQQSPLQISHHLHQKHRRLSCCWVE